MEAVGVRGEREETQTDNHGAFRLRGLIPGTEYTLSIKPQADRIERASPAQHHVVMPHAEIHDKHFVVFRRPPKVDLTGEVSAVPASLLQSLWVRAASVYLMCVRKRLTNSLRWSCILLVVTAR